ncbi:hypothetical protein BCR44DRAFT_34013 [Catenaria anguillulae PL171]|uniref:FHA domain-containing protein n=1 Tax=Catenaria anguillulae PL171 TaxID=765915 RepID=A0A1Y2HW91_9FUNG|nr:hypothetical protein BCR44DRAFT_34013 [Catenaria anguillulae PL171]
MSSSTSRPRDRERDRHRRRSRSPHSRSRSRSPPRSTRDPDRPLLSTSSSAATIRYAGDRADNYTPPASASASSAHQRQPEPDLALPRRPNGPVRGGDQYAREADRDRDLDRERERSSRDNDRDRGDRSHHGRRARRDDPPAVSGGGGDGYYPTYDDSSSNNARDVRGRDRDRDRDSDRDHDRSMRGQQHRDRDVRDRDRDRYQAPRTEYTDSRGSSRYVNADTRRSSVDTGRGGGGDDARLVSREYDRKRNRDQPNETMAARRYDEYRPNSETGPMGPPSRNRDWDRDSDRDRTGDRERNRDRGKDDGRARKTSGADEYRGRDELRHREQHESSRYLNQVDRDDQRDSLASSSYRRDTARGAHDERPADRDHAPRSTQPHDSREMPPPPPLSSHTRRDTSTDRSRRRKDSTRDRSAPKHDGEPAPRRDGQRSRSPSRDSRGSSSRRPDIYHPPPSDHRDRTDKDGGDRAARSNKRRHSPPRPHSPDPARDTSPPPAKPVEKPSFVPSGTLNLAATTVTLASGRQVQLKYSPPSDASAPAPNTWALFICKHDKALATIELEPTRTRGAGDTKTYWMLGRDPEQADVLVDSPSVSGQQAVVQFRRGGTPYLLDLESTNGTYLNGDKVEPARYVELKSKDVVRFGASKREIMVLDVSSVAGKR